MPENEFEKQVQQKMEEFRLRPGEPVWEGIEKEINKRKRRRIILFILPILAGLLLLGYGGYRILLPSKNSKSIFTVQNKEQEGLAIPSTKPIDSKPSTGGQRDQQLIAAKPISVRKGGQAVAVNNVQSIEENKKLNRDKLYPAAVYRMDQLFLVSKEISRKPGEKSTDIEYHYSLPELVKNKSNPTKGTTRKRGSITFAFSTGVSDIWRNSISSQGQGLGSVVGSPAYPGGTQTLPRADFYSGPAFKAGLHWEKGFARRLTFATGLNYAYYSARNKVGGQTAATLQVYYADLGNQSITSYYYGAPQESFMNRYHFIEIPAAIKWQVNKSQKLPVTLNMGVSLSRLLSTNAVIYDTARGGIYFHSNNLFNKTHVNLNGGISIGTGKWSVGPQWSLDLTKNLRGGLDKSQYLFAAYLEFRYRISRK